MNFYQLCTDYVTENNDCPFILENFDSKNKSEYVLVRTNTRNITQEERRKLEEKYKICKTVGYVHVYKAYDVDSAKTYLIDNKNNDPLTRQKPSDDILKKIEWKYNNKKYIKSNYNKVYLFNIFCQYYNNTIELDCDKKDIFNILHFNNDIKLIILDYLIDNNDVNEMKCNLTPNDFNCFVDCKRDETKQLLKEYSWLLRPSKIDSFDFYNNIELQPCSIYYAISIKVNSKINHYLFEHSFGEGYYICSGSYNNEGIPDVKRKSWFGSFVYALEHLIKNNNISILDYYKN